MIRGMSQSELIGSLRDALESERSLLRALIDQIPDLVYVKDRESRFVVANMATAMLMGAAKPDDLIGRSDHDFYPQALADEFRIDERTVLEHGLDISNHEERVVDTLGTDRWILTTKRPLRNQDGEIIGLIGVGRDVTMRRRAEDALHQAHAALKERQRADNEEIQRLRAALEAKDR
jgi:PAS domain S-box-containing protein